MSTLVWQTKIKQTHSNKRSREAKILVTWYQLLLKMPTKVATTKNTWPRLKPVSKTLFGNILKTLLDKVKCSWRFYINKIVNRIHHFINPVLFAACVQAQCPGWQQQDSGGRHHQCAGWGGRGEREGWDDTNLWHYRQEERGQREPCPQQQRAQQGEQLFEQTCWIETLGAYL